MAALLLLSLALLLLAVLIGSLVVDAAVTHSTKRTEQVRVDREVRRAEHQLHRLASDAFEALLSEARRGNHSSREGRP